MHLSSPPGRRRASTAELVVLARCAQAGDPRARHALLIELYEPVRRHVQRVARPAVADDAVQETMIALDRGLATYRGDAANPRTWALAIATRIARRLSRREARYQLVDEGIVEVEVLDAGPTAAAELAVLPRALARLAGKKRDALVLMAIFDLSAAEAGRALGTFASTAASRFRHARAELQLRWRPPAPCSRATMCSPARLPRA